MRVSCGLSTGRVTSQSKWEHGALTKPGLAGHRTQAVMGSRRDGAARRGPAGRAGWEERAVPEVNVLTGLFRLTAWPVVVLPGICVCRESSAGGADWGE